jgi:RND family efflux transporter MFP subunit
MIHVARPLRSLLAVPLIALGACHHDVAPPAERGPAVPVAVVNAHVEPLPVMYRASGTVRGRSTVTMTSKVAGYVRAVHVRAGDTVTAGQLLVELEANDTRAGVNRHRAELAQAQDARVEAASQVDAARVAAQLARKNVERDQRLLDGGAITRQAMDQSQAQASATAAQLAAAQARMRAASSAIDIAQASLDEGQATLDYARVTAPFAGRVVERRVDPGALASPAMPLLVLDDGASLRVEAAVEESRASAIHLGDTVTVEVGGREVEGTVGEIVPNIDVASRAFLVKIDLSAEVGALQPGTFARVEFAAGSRPQLVVPTTAITSLGALDRVFVVDDSLARLRMITRGEARGPWTEVLSGLSNGERVIGDPADLRDGARIEVRP